MRGRHRVVPLLAATIAAATPSFVAPVDAASGGAKREPGSTETVNRVLLDNDAPFGRAAGVQGTEDRAPAPIVVRVDGGFDWAAAGVGAAGLLGLVLVVGAGVSAVRCHPRVDGKHSPSRR